MNATSFHLGKYLLFKSKVRIGTLLAGTITSVTRLASSWARTLDRLTLDCRDLERSEQLRRLRPQSLTQGVVQGLSEFGISLIGELHLQTVCLNYFSFFHSLFLRI